jgi:hypothetical protein
MPPPQPLNPLPQPPNKLFLSYVRKLRPNTLRTNTHTTIRHVNSHIHLLLRPQPSHRHPHHTNLSSTFNLKLQPPNQNLHPLLILQKLLNNRIHHLINPQIIQQRQLPNLPMQLITNLNNHPLLLFKSLIGPRLLQHFPFSFHV